MTKHVSLVIHQLQPEQFPFNCRFHVTQNQALTGILTPRAEGNFWIWIDDLTGTISGYYSGSKSGRHHLTAEVCWQMKQ